MTARFALPAYLVAFSTAARAADGKRPVVPRPVPNQRAMTIVLEPLTAMTPGLLPGHRVDIIATTTNADDKTTCRVVVTDVFVLAIDGHMEWPPKSATISVIVNQAQAAKLVAAQATGTLSAVIRPMDEKDQEEDRIPKKVMDALKARFPKAEIDKWTREKEGDIVVYDIEFKQDGQKFEADIREDGTIHNWEREIAAKDLPAAVMKAVQAKYPGATLKEIMAITAVQDKKEALEGYEIVLVTADKKKLEITLAPDGKILEEDAGD